LWDADTWTASGANITISTMDASTQLAFTADLRATVQQIRNAVVVRTGLLRFDLFAQGAEDKLQAGATVGSLVDAPGGSVALFLLQTQTVPISTPQWCFDKSGSGISLSWWPRKGLVAASYGCRSLVTSSQPMTEGRHYWEVKPTKGEPDGYCCVFVGAVRPGLDHDKSHYDTNDAYYIGTGSGGLYGNGKQHDDKQGRFAVGDRVGVLLDLDAGWLRFYRNGERYGPGFTEGVTGPLVRAAQLCTKGDQVTVLPGAVAPEGAGAADEPW
jgi:hypothetical protein